MSRHNEDCETPDSDGRGNDAVTDDVEPSKQTASLPGKQQIERSTVIKARDGRDGSPHRIAPRTTGPVSSQSSESSSTLEESLGRNSAQTTTVPSQNTDNLIISGLSNEADSGLSPSPTAFGVTKEVSGEPKVSSSPEDSVDSQKPGLQFIIPNASVGKVFDKRVPAIVPDDYQPLSSLDALDLKVSGHEECGIKVSTDGLDLVFAGTPRSSGETPLKVTYNIPANRDDRPRDIKTTVDLSWFINPDPQSLWKRIEPDPALPYQKKGSYQKQLSGRETLIAGSVRGRSHAHQGAFRDDHVVIDQGSANDWNLLVVCDGAGSAKYSRRGSEIACDVIREKIQTHFDESLNEVEQLANNYLQRRSPELEDKIRLLLYSPLGGTAMEAFKAIQVEADSREDAQLNDFATTLILTIAKKFPLGWFVGAFCIGDGGVGIYSKSRSVKTLNTPDGGEFAGQTRFLTMRETWSSGENVMSRIRFEVCEEMTALLAMTDGVSDAKFETNDEFSDTEAWHSLWNDLESEVGLSRTNPDASKQLLKWLDFWSPGNHDDRTIAILLP